MIRFYTYDFCLHLLNLKCFFSIKNYPAHRPFSTDAGLSWQVNASKDVSSEVKILPDKPFVFALTGSDLQYLTEHHPELVDAIILRGRIFARINPDEKAEIVEKFENLGFVTAYCGDGANDCSALKRASVGISLSELEASVAAPFTARNE